MGSEWRESTWGQEISLEYGKPIRGYRDSSGPYQVFGSNGTVGWWDEALAQGPGVILGRKGAYRGVQFSAEPFWVIDTAYYVVPKSKLDMRWLYYAIQHYKLGEIDDGSPIPSTTRAAVYVERLAVPPIEEQRGIAAVLGALDDRIESLRNINVTLEAIAQALFKSWFVDFDPVRAKAEGREPEGMDGETAALFPTELADSEVGPIPKGWRAGQLSDVLELKYGKSLRAADRKDGEVPVYGSGGVTGFHDKPLIEGPTVIVGRKGTVGSIYWEPLPCFPIDTVFYVEPKQCLHFAYFALRQAGLDGLNTDAAVPGLNRNNAYRQPIVIPPPEVVGAWGNLAVALRARMDTSQAHAATLRQLRDTLLPRLISGKLRLPDAEQEIEAATA